MSVHQEDTHGNELTLDEKHCDANELRLVVNGQEFYLDKVKHRDVLNAIVSHWPQIVVHTLPAPPTVIGVPVAADRWLR